MVNKRNFAQELVESNFEIIIWAFVIFAAFIVVSLIYMTYFDKDGPMYGKRGLPEGFPTFAIIQLLIFSTWWCAVAYFFDYYFEWNIGRKSIFLFGLAFGYGQHIFFGMAHNIRESSIDAENGKGEPVSHSNQSEVLKSD